MSAEALFEATDEIRLARFLSRRQRGAHIVAPQAVLQTLKELAPAAPWTGSTSLDSAPQPRQRLYVYSETDERGLIAEARTRYPRIEVLGILHDVIPRLVCRPPEQRDTKMSPPSATEPRRKFAVICAPRTGSTYFCELLQAAGLGVPREHLRHALVHVLRSPGVDRDAVMRVVMAHGQQHGIFGTKLISHFLIDAVGADAAGSTLACLQTQGFAFIHLTRDIAEQAVSKFVAEQSRVWHVRGPTTEQQQQRLDAVDYDGTQLHALYRAARAESRAVENALATVPRTSVLTIDHADFTSAPIEALRRTAQLLDVPVPDATVPLQGLPQRLSAELPAMGAMLQRLRSELSDD